MANWFEKILPSFIRKDSSKKSTIPEGLWQSCSSCSNILYVPELEAALFVCPKCDHHMKIGARIRLESFLDEEYRKEIELLKNKWCRGVNKQTLSGCMTCYARPSYSANITKLLRKRD